ncbi:MAG: DUF3488 and transglutaminase-like domain-containing protein, partial [Bifidobacteriaceae bacterium]|nr:DUF3488 and transglutaminase-like domain-containing protein [Bifidobacteriaceae bacterium]
MLLVAALTAAMVGLFTGSDWQAWFAGPALGVLALLASLRLAGAPAWLSPIVALVAGIEAMLGLFGTGEGLVRLVPTPVSIEHVRGLFAEAFTLVVESSTPVTPTPELMLVTASAAGLLALLLDLLVIEAGLGSVAAIAALVALAVPVSVNSSGIHLGRASVAVAAVLMVLWAATPRWVRPPAHGEPIAARLGPPSSRIAAALGTMTVVALAAGLSAVAVPGYSTTPLVDALPKVVYFANGPNPLVDLGADLTDRVTKEALRLTTDMRPPPYLRMVTLEDFTGDTWRHRSSEPAVVQAEGSTRLDVGEDVAGQGEARWSEIEVTGMRSQWLPVPYPVRAVTGLTGQWFAEEGDLSIRALEGSAHGQSYRADSPDEATEYEVVTRTFGSEVSKRVVVGPDGNVTQMYTVPNVTSGDAEGSIGVEVSEDEMTFSSVRLNFPESAGGETDPSFTLAVPEPAEGEAGEGGGATVIRGSPGGSDAPALTDPDLPASVREDLALPPDLPPIIRETADTIAGDLDDPEAQAAALEAFLAESELFTYSTSAPSARGYEGDSAATVAAFLQQGAGYCVHFASAMTLMARSLGIPARIAIGYVPGAAVDDLADGRKVYSVTTRSLHSWPELYIPRLGGWISFEPTPGLVPGAAPPRDSAVSTA